MTIAMTGIITMAIKYAIDNGYAYFMQRKMNTSFTIPKNSPQFSISNRYTFDKEIYLGVIFDNDKSDGFFLGGECNIIMPVIGTSQSNQNILRGGINITRSSFDEAATYLGIDGKSLVLVHSYQTSSTDYSNIVDVPSVLIIFKSNLIDSIT